MLVEIDTIRKLLATPSILFRHHYQDPIEFFLEPCQMRRLETVSTFAVSSKMGSSPEVLPRGLCKYFLRTATGSKAHTESFAVSIFL